MEVKKMQSKNRTRAFSSREKENFNEHLLTSLQCSDLVEGKNVFGKNMKRLLEQINTILIFSFFCITYAYLRVMNRKDLKF